MGIIEIYTNEIKLTETRFFIIDTFLKGNSIVDHNDVDFREYRWDTKINNRIRKGDLFIYRRPQRNSEYKDGRFYLFGAGKFGDIYQISNDKTIVLSEIEKPVKFSYSIFEEDLENFNWKFKQKGKSWRGFFTQYGITQIEKEDFVNILMLQESVKMPDLITLDVEGEKIAVEIFQQQQMGNYHVDDTRGNIKTRGSAQKVFADRVKGYYKYMCAVTGISQKEFLVASHIVPWKDDPDNRINPQNGICLSVLFDKAFDQGYITFLNNGKMIISEFAKKDKVLYEDLKKYEYAKIDMNMLMAPAIEFLEWHREHIFKK